MARGVGVDAEEEMDGRGGGKNGSATSKAEGSSSRQGGMERCGQSRHQDSDDDSDHISPTLNLQGE